MRPSAAMRIACSVASAVMRSCGSAGQTLCASSITISTGERSSRRSHSRPSTAAAVSDCSVRVGSDPRSTTSPRRPVSRAASSVEPASPRAHTPSRSIPRLRTRSAELLRVRAVRGEEGLQRERALGGQDLVERRVLLEVGDRVQPQQRRLGRGLEVAEAQPQPIAALRAGAVHVEEARDAAVAARQPRRHVAAHLAEPDVVGVGVEHDDAQRRLQQQPLEQHAERVRLARARLPAQERVAVEPGGVERQRHAGDERELAGVELRAARRAALEPRGDLRGLGRADRAVVERRAVALEQRPGAEREPERQAGRRDRAVVAFERELGGLARRGLETLHLPEQGAAAPSRSRRSRRPGARGRAARHWNENARPSIDPASGSTDSSSSRRSAR